jgi:hypothetical protein
MEAPGGRTHSLPSGRICRQGNEWKKELLNKVWQNAFLEDGSLTRTISILRKVLEAGAPAESFPGHLVGVDDLSQATVPWTLRIHASYHT